MCCKSSFLKKHKARFIADYLKTVKRYRNPYYIVFPEKYKIYA